MTAAVPVTAVVLFAHPSPELYGSDRMLVDSVRAVCDSGGRAVVVLPADGPLRAALARAGAQVRYQDFPVLRKKYMTVRGCLRWLWLTAAAVPRLVRLVRETGPDVVYVNTLTIPVWQVAARVARVPCLVHVHEAEDAGRLVSLALAAPLMLARVTVVNSRAARASLEAGVPRLARRIRLIYNGVEPPPDARPPGRAPHVPARLVLVGRLSSRKGTDVAVEAVAVLRRAGRDVVLDLVGATFAGAEWFEKDLRTAADGLLGSVHFHGFQPDPYRYLAGSDIVLVPSRVEPFGNVAVEALLAWRPLVASGVQGLSEIVEQGRTGLLVPPDDPRALAAAVARLLDDWPFAVSLATAGRTDAQERFGPGRYRREILDVVTSLCGEGPVSRGGPRRRTRRSSGR